METKSNEFDQEPSRVVSDPKIVKVLLHPLRTRLIVAMSGEPRSVGELSSIVDVPVTKLYYHVKLLLKAGLVAAVDERRVGNLTETLYLATAREFRFDPQGLGFGESSDPFAAGVRPFLKRNNFV